jgi:adenine/guanine phosphoribosyltransferase-like PRPP-binding protein
MIPLMAGRRIALIDDVISSRVSMLAGIALLEKCGVKPAALGTAMLQSERWEERLAGWDIVSVLRSPVLTVE